MLNINFAQDSLLYGESWLLAWIVWFIPFFLYPDLGQTQTNHYLSTTNARRRLLIILEWLHDQPIIILFTLRLVIVSQIMYVLLLITIGVIVQRDFLQILDKKNENELSYKALYYAPILVRIGLFLMVIVALINRTEYKDWRIFDKYQIFSLTQGRQVKIMFGCLLVFVPDCICCWKDVMVLVDLLRGNRYKFLQSTVTNNNLNLAFLSVVSFVSLSNVIIRYKPFITVLYSAKCLRYHLRLIRLQMLAEHLRRANKPVAAIACQLEHRRHLDLLEFDELKEELPGPARPIHQVVSAGSQHSESSANSSGPKCEIKNMFEFERHLTRVYLFTSDVDRSSPAAVFSMTLFNAVATFNAFLFVRALPADRPVNPYYIVLFLTARMIPILSLHIAGHQVERECRKMMTLIEVIYFQQGGAANPSQALLYKQMKGSQYSLMRVFKLLNMIKFDGNGLMSINLESLSQIAVYIVGAIFIVIQYDSLLTLEDATGGATEPWPKDTNES